MNTAPALWPLRTYILIPSYKAARSLETFLPQCTAVAGTANVCVVDDGSHDGTEDVCRRLGVECLSSLLNKGKGAALARGFIYLIAKKNASWIITMDADGQHSVADLPLFLDAIRTAPDAGMIIGKRDMMPGKMPLARICSNVLTSAIMSLATRGLILDSQCGFRAYSARLINEAPCRFQRFEMESEIIMRARAGRFSVNFIRVQTLYFSTQSHISHVIDTLRWLRAVITIFLELRHGRHQACTH